MSKVFSLARALPTLSLGACLGLGVAPASLALSTSLVAQQVSTVPLGRAEATYEEPFTLLSGVRELPGGKVVVLDIRDKSVQLVDMASGTATRIGREGSGPGEYQFPRGLLPMPNNETWLIDPMQTRFLRIDAAGKILETISYPSGMGPGMQAVGTDAAGRIYWEGSAIGGGGGQLAFSSNGPGGGIQTADSVPVIRWDRRANRFDTLARVKGPQMKINVSGGQNQRNVMVRQQPYTPRDAWGVAPDGRVAMVRSGEYRVDNIRPTGEMARGAAVGMRPIPVTARDKEDFIKNQRNAPRMVRTIGGSNASAPSLPEPSAEDYEWPASKPFFEAASVRMSPTGELWSLRSRAAGDEIPVYDVFGADGRLVRRVSFPARTRLVGFGTGAVYVARTDADDLQYLERYRMP